MRNAHCRTWNMVINLENEKKRETHKVGPLIWRETLKKVENEKCTTKDLKYGKKTEKRGK